MMALQYKNAMKHVLRKEAFGTLSPFIMYSYLTYLWVVSRFLSKWAFSFINTSSKATSIFQHD